MSDGTGLAEALLGLDDFRVLAVTESPGELVVEIETTVVIVGCAGCGGRAANRQHRPLYATGLVDLDAGILIGLVEGNSAGDLREWDPPGADVAGGDQRGHHRPGRVLPGRAHAAPGPRDARRRPVPCGA